MRRTQTSALVPSALATEITRSDFAVFGIVSKDSRAAIRSDAIRYKMTVLVPLCCSLDPMRAASSGLEVQWVDGHLSLLSAGVACTSKEGSRGERTQSRWQVAKLQGLGGLQEAA